MNITLIIYWISVLSSLEKFAVFIMVLSVAIMIVMGIILMVIVEIDGHSFLDLLEKYKFKYFFIAFICASFINLFIN